jgi:MFS family permease
MTDRGSRANGDIMTRRAYAVIVAGFFTVAIAYGIRYGYGMLLPEMLPSWEISKTQAGMIYTAYFMVYTVFTPFLGTLSDRYNNRVILTCFTAVLALGALLMSLATTVLSASLFFSIAGLGHAACWAPVMALVQRWVPEEKKGMVLSLVGMGVGLGIPLWGFLLPVIVSAYHWQAGWICMGIVGGGVALLNAVLVRNPPGFTTKKASGFQDPKSKDRSYRSLFGHKTLWIIGLSYLLIGFNVLVPFTFISVYTRETLDFSYAVSTRFIAVIGIVGIVSQLTLGPLSDILGRISMMIVCGMFMGIGCLGMAVFKTEWGLYLSTGIYGMGYGAVWPLYAAAASDFLPKSKAGSVVGIWTVFLGGGFVVAPVLCGWTIDATGTYTWTFLMGLFSGLLSALFLVPLLKPVGRTRSPAAD